VPVNSANYRISMRKTISGEHYWTIDTNKSFLLLRNWIIIAFNFKEILEKNLDFGKEICKALKENDIFSGCLSLQDWKATLSCTRNCLSHGYPIIRGVNGHLTFTSMKMKDKDGTLLPLPKPVTEHLDYCKAFNIFRKFCLLVYLIIY